MPAIKISLEEKKLIKNLTEQGFEAYDIYEEHFKNKDITQASINYWHKKFSGIHKTELDKSRELVKFMKYLWKEIKSADKRGINSIEKPYHKIELMKIMASIVNSEVKLAQLEQNQSNNTIFMQRIETAYQRIIDESKSIESKPRELVQHT